MGDVRVLGSRERFTSIEGDAIGESGREMDCELRFFTRRCEVFVMRALDFANI